MSDFAEIIRRMPGADRELKEIVNRLEKKEKGGKGEERKRATEQGQGE